ncbi:28S ribosomal protein S14, mitochondrial [Anthophora plagiata]
MAALKSSFSILSNLLSNNTNVTLCCFQQIRNKYYGRWMIRDAKRRRMAKEYADERLRLVAMKRNNILPPEIIEDVAKEIDEKIPRQTALRQLTPRCILTSRARGNVKKWRVSRFIFRHLSDYNKLAGVQRALW